MSRKEKNAYLARQKAIRQAYVRASERVTQQLMVDCMILTLNEEFGFGYDRSRRAVDGLTKRYLHYYDALDGGPEADYAQEKLDDALRRVIKDQEPFHPFRERYPDIKEITCGKK